MLSLPPCKHLGDISPLPLNEDGTPAASFDAVTLISIEATIPAFPSKEKHDPHILETTDSILGELKPGRMLLMENKPPFEAIIHPALKDYATETELIRHWWGAYRHQGCIVAALTVEVYVPSIQQAYKYILYESKLTKKISRAFISHFVNCGAHSFIIGMSPS